MFSSLPISAIKIPGASKQGLRPSPDSAEVSGNFIAEYQSDGAVSVLIITLPWDLSNEPTLGILPLRMQLLGSLHRLTPSYPHDTELSI